MESGSNNSPRLSFCTAPLKIILSIVVASFLLFLTFGIAGGQPSEEEQAVGTGQPTDMDITTADGDEKEASGGESTGYEVETETLTMSISLEEGGVIDLKPPPRDVKIETWKGNEVLFIVEKVSRPNKRGKRTQAVKPFNIQVTRKGIDVEIETVGGEGWEQSGVDVSFRIIVPEKNYFRKGASQKSYILSKLTSVLWRMLNKEAFSWF